MSHNLNDLKAFKDARALYKNVSRYVLSNISKEDSERKDELRDKAKEIAKFIYVAFSNQYNPEKFSRYLKFAMNEIDNISFLLQELARLEINMDQGRIIDLIRKYNNLKSDLARFNQLLGKK
ncbi:MAG: hypothetical protein COU22_01460 [Candidatus Komeilibacteria bacterium CG10_big_fil_rev_8_21_14_0_10_41_13]|uniref:Four helix bundle protein n=1 Tax=Candidatus Komeilibacteria bacterium CG10_big_fil_rev_8_21_14_0_10_41_13 TaxID=1974476 RepID=A0A2M6WCR0_9BACT|nr:MAG: hypothetical protein COU22_01460 [Candidatus Komeilibacteria bacterium CG10_big_fil_rev_8_21_14_0_10_41_13]